MVNQASNIQKLRELSGAGVMDCKRALEEAGGDFGRAVEIIKSKGLARAEKRAGRETGEGIIYAYVHGGRIGVILDLRAETDFVVKSRLFQDLAKEIAMQVAALAPVDVNELLKQPYIRDESLTIESLVQEVIGKTGENIRVNKFCRLEI